MDPITCPVCGKPVDINTEAHISEPLWSGSDKIVIRHNECPVEEEENE